MARQSRAHSPVLPPILLTRPVERSARFKRELRRAFGTDLEIVNAPLLTVRYLDPVLPKGPFTAIIFTSESGVAAYMRMAGRPPIAPRAWCVGDRTAKAARKTGMPIDVGGGDAKALCDAIIASAGAGPMLHFRGQDTRGEVAERLAEAGIPTQSVAGYEQVAQSLTPKAQHLLTGEGPVVAPIFSPRTAQILMAERARIGGTTPLWFAALSSAVADCLRLRDGDRIATSETPDSAGLISAMERFLPGGA